MKPQHQLREDDCIRACVATILEIPIETIPNFMVEDRVEMWIDELRQWLAPMGFSAMCLFFLDETEEENTRGILCGAGGPGPRGKPHMVVWRDGQMVWDPHPDGGGIIGEPEDFLLFLPLDPSKAIVGNQK